MQSLIESINNIDISESHADECPEGQYFCNDEQKCKPIPSGHKVMADGELVKESEMDEEIENIEENSNIITSEDHQMLSDLYKDVYGFRPRGIYKKNMTVNDYRKEIQRLLAMGQEDRIRNKQDRIKRKVDTAKEKQIQKKRTFGPDKLPKTTNVGAAFHRALKNRKKKNTAEAREYPYTQLKSRKRVGSIEKMLKKQGYSLTQNSVRAIGDEELYALYQELVRKNTKHKLLPHLNKELRRRGQDFISNDIR